MLPVPESVLVALVGLVGVLAGHAAGLRTHRQDYQAARAGVEVAGLRALVDSLTARVAALEQALAAAEARAEIAARVRAEAERDRWHAIEYARQALAWGRDVRALLPPDATSPPEPPIPPPIADEL